MAIVSAASVERHSLLIRWLRQSTRLDIHGLDVLAGDEDHVARLRTKFVRVGPTAVAEHHDLRLLEVHLPEAKAPILRRLSLLQQLVQVEEAIH